MYCQEYGRCLSARSEVVERLLESYSNRTEHNEARVFGIRRIGLGKFRDCILWSRGYGGLSSVQVPQIVDLCPAP